MDMNGSPDVLRHLEVASPCTARWDAMQGDDRVRFCGQCHLNVYNISGMGRREAERLVGSREGRLCVRFYRRADGTVLTRDCGAAARRLARTVFSMVCGFIALVLTGTIAGAWTADLWMPGFLRPVWERATTTARRDRQMTGMIAPRTAHALGGLALRPRPRR
jgi:hypothetical protein